MGDWISPSSEYGAVIAVMAFIAPWDHRCCNHKGYGLPKKNIEKINKLDLYNFRGILV